MAERGIDGAGLAAVSFGILFVWAGAKGYSVVQIAQNLITGTPPSLGQRENTLVQIPSTAVGSASVSPLVHGQFSNSDLQKLWILNGGNPGKAAVAACIADHESSGNPSATSPNPDGGTNVGLWQLDTNGVGSGHSVDQLKDPNTNAKLAIQGSANGTNWSEWATAAGCGA